MVTPANGFWVFLSITYPLIRAWGIFWAFNAAVKKVEKERKRRNLKFMSIVDDLKN
jgi:hypothetical protein